MIISVKSAAKGGCGSVAGAQFLLGMKLMIMIPILFSVSPAARATATTTTTDPALFFPTPIKNWNPSWVASSAQGTIVVALECQAEPGEVDKDTTNDNSNNSNHQIVKDTGSTAQSWSSSSAVLLLIRTTSRPSHQQQQQQQQQQQKYPASDDTIQSLFGLKLDKITQWMEASSLVSPSAWLPPKRSCCRVLTPTILCCMIGFLPDVDFLHRIIQVQLQGYEFVYQSNTVSRDEMSTAFLAQNVLGNAVRQVTSMDPSGRPFGIQALLIGRKQQQGRNLELLPWASSSLWHLYTTDPSGQVRSWNGGGTVIGKHASAVRFKLHERLLKHHRKAHKKTLLTPREALEMAIRSILDVTKSLPNDKNILGNQMASKRNVNAEGDEDEDFVNDMDNHDDESCFEAMLLWTDGTTQWMGQVALDNHHKNYSTNPISELA